MVQTRLISEGESMGKFVKLFGKPIAIKTKGCNHDGYEGGPIPPSVNLFVKITNNCNALCPFCSNAGYRSTSVFDVDKLFMIIEELLSSQIMINRLNITGGEPSSEPDRTREVLS